MDAPLANLLKLARIFNKDLNAQLHAGLLQIDVETGNFGARDALLHGWNGRERRRIAVTSYIP